MSNYMQADVEEWQWSHYDANGEKHWTSYPKETCQILTEARRRKKTATIILDSNGVKYKVSFSPPWTQQRLGDTKEVNAVRVRKLPCLADGSSSDLDLSQYSMAELSEIIEKSISPQQQTSGHFSFPHAFSDHSMPRNEWDSIFRTVSLSIQQDPITQRNVQTAQGLEHGAWVEREAKDLARSLTRRVSTISAIVETIFNTARKSGFDEAPIFEQVSRILQHTQEKTTPLPIEASAYAMSDEIPALSLWENRIKLKNRSQNAVKIRLLHPHRLDYHHFFSSTFLAASSSSCSSTRSLATSSDKDQAPHDDFPELDQSNDPISTLKSINDQPWSNEVEVAPYGEVDLLLFFCFLRPLESTNTEEQFHHLIQVAVEPVSISMATETAKTRPSVTIGLSLLRSRGSLGGSHWDLSKLTESIYIGSRLGSGAFGSVYEVNMFGCTCAMKICRQPELWAQEKIISQFQNPHIMPLLGVGQLVNSYYLVLKKGETSLKELLQQTKTLKDGHGVDPDVGLLLYLLFQIARGINSIHEGGFIHRDIKSANVMVTDGKAEIIDFGLVVSSNRPSAQFAGTKIYMAPEIERRGKAQQKSDVYSFGMLLYEVAHLGIENEPTKLQWNDSSLIRRGFDNLGDLFCWCTSTEPDKRPTMAVVSQRLHTSVSEFPPLRVNGGI